MQRRIEKCLVFTGKGAETAAPLIPLLTRQGVCATPSATPDECLDLLGTYDWRFLAVDASGEIRGALHVLALARQTWPTIPVLVIVRQGDTQTAVRAMKLGAFDCIEAPIEAIGLHAAVQALNGHEDRDADDPLHALTRVERIVLRHVLDGRTNREIANAMSRSPRTVEVHRRHIMQKLDASNLIDLVKRVFRAGDGDQQRGQALSVPRPPRVA